MNDFFLFHRVSASVVVVLSFLAPSLASSQFTINVGLEARQMRSQINLHDPRVFDDEQSAMSAISYSPVIEVEHNTTSWFTSSLSFSYHNYGPRQYRCRLCFAPLLGEVTYSSIDINAMGSFKWRAFNFGLGVRVLRALRNGQREITGNYAPPGPSDRELLDQLSYSYESHTGLAPQFGLGYRWKRFRLSSTYLVVLNQKKQRMRAGIALTSGVTLSATYSVLGYRSPSS